MKKTGILIISLIMLSAQIGLAETYNIHSYLSLVKKHSKNLKLAAEEKKIAKVNKKAAISTALPQIGFEAGYTRNITDYYMYFDMSAFQPGATGVAKAPVKRDNEYTAAVALNQTLFSPAVGNAIKAANQYKKLTDFIYEANEQAIITSAKKMYYSTLLLEKFWQVSEAAEENAKENYEHMKLKYENGVISELELLQADVRWKEAIPATAGAKRNYELSLNNLKNWAGIPVREHISLTGNFESYPAIPHELSFDGVLQLRPDFNALLWEEKLRKTNVSAKKNTYLPTLTGSVAYSYSAQSDKYQLDEENKLLFAGVKLSMPIFTGGYLRSEVQKAQIELTKTRIKIDQSKENMYNDMSNVYLMLKEAHQRITSAQATLNIAEKAFTIAENTARSGLTTQLQLKDTRVQFDQAKMNYYAATYDYLTAYFEWEHVTGQVK